MKAGNSIKLNATKVNFFTKLKNDYKFTMQILNIQNTQHSEKEKKFPIKNPQSGKMELICKEIR